MQTATPTARTASATTVLVVAGLGVFMVFLDTQVLFVAFGDIRASFPGVSAASLSWVLSGYTLTIAAALVPAGRLADRWGRKMLFLAGLTVFTLASVACGLAPNPGFLVAGRIGQALGAAAITPSSLALVLRATPRERVPVAVAVWGAMGALAAAMGPTLGALLVDWFGWRSVFFVNVPVCALALLAGRAVLRESRETDAGAFPDLVGSAVLATAIAAISLSLVQSDTWGWVDRRTLAAVVAGIVLFAAFVRRSRSQAAPAVDLSLFEIRSFRWGNLATAAFTLAFTAMFLNNVLFLTQAWDYGIVRAGLAVAPGPLVVVFFARPAGQLAARIGQRRLLVPGGLVYAAGGLLLVTRADASPDYLWEFLPTSLLAGLGVALTLPQLSSAAVQQLPADRFALGSAVNQTIRQLGATFGVALVVSFTANAATDGGLAAYQRGWWLLVVCGIATSLLSLGLPRPDDQTSTLTGGADSTADHMTSSGVEASRA